MKKTFCIEGFCLICCYVVVVVVGLPCSGGHGIHQIPFFSMVILCFSLYVFRVLRPKTPTQHTHFVFLKQVSFDMPEYTADCDGIGVLRILDAIRAAGLEKSVKFYQASTSELYGKVQEVPQSETTPFYPRSPYAGTLLSFHKNVSYCKWGFTSEVKGLMHIVCLIHRMSVSTQLPSNMPFGSLSTTVRPTGCI